MNRGPVPLFAFTLFLLALLARPADLRADGQADGTVFALEPNGQGDQVSPSVAVLSDGTFVVVWARHEGGGWSLQGSLLAPSGEASPFEVEACCGPRPDPLRVLADPDSGFTVFWSGQTVRGRRFDQHGAELFDLPTVDAGTSTGVDRPAKFANDRILVPYTIADNATTAYAAEYDEDGALVDAAIPYSLGPAGSSGGSQSRGAAAPSSDGTWVVAYDHDGRLRTRHGRAGGELTGPPVTVVDRGLGAVSSHDLAAGVSGGLLVFTAQSPGGSSLEALSLDDDGRPSAASFAVGEAVPGGARTDVDLTGTGDGRWVAAWIERDGTEAIGEVRARTLVDGAVLGPEIAVGPCFTSADEPWETCPPDVAMAPDGTALAVWSTRLLGGSAELGVAGRWLTTDFSAGCGDTPEVLCIDGRFAVSATFRVPGGELQRARRAEQRTGDSGLFWFHGPDNWELMVKVLDGCRLNGHRWVFASGSTNSEFELRVMDTADGAVRTYRNPQGTLAVTITDTEAFPGGCP